MSKSKPVIEFDVAVIGTGQAGPTLAMTLSGRGEKVALIEEGLVGGSCVNNGCAPTKTRRKSVRVAHLARRAGDFCDGADAASGRRVARGAGRIDRRTGRPDIAAWLGHLCGPSPGGRFELAAADCQAIHTGALIGVGFLCQSTAMLLTAQAPAIYKRLVIVTKAPQLLDPSLKPWALGLMGEIAALQGDRPSARLHLQDVLTLNPLAIRERLILADLMLQDGEGLTVTTLLQDAPPTDGVLIRRVLAGQAQGQTDDADTAVLAKRFKLNLDLGLTAHAREEARYYLQIAHDPATALQRALVNWGLQHEVDDASLLIDAAMAAGQPAAALPVLQWMAAERVVIPSLTIPDAVRKAAP